jgi:hypothetical protein
MGETPPAAAPPAAAPDTLEAHQRAGAAAFAAADFAGARAAFAAAATLEARAAGASVGEASGAGATSPAASSVFAGASGPSGSAATLRWLRKCDAELSLASGGPGVGISARPAGGAAASARSGAGGAAAAEPSASGAAAASPAAPLRHAWFQSADHVTVELRAAGVPPADVDVEVRDRLLTVSLKGGATFTRALFAAVVPADARTRVLPTKVEIRMRKAEPAQARARVASRFLGLALLFGCAHA